jgi:hypothetical protein
MKRALLSLILLPLLVFPLAGCPAASSSTPPAALVPGALNQFDQTSYATLMSVQAALNSLNASYKANPTGLASLKAILDQAAADYNIAELAWQTYHAASTAANQAAVTSAITKTQSDLLSATKAATN